MKQGPVDQKHRSEEQEPEMARQVGRDRLRWGRRGSGVGMRAGWATLAIVLGACPPRNFLTHTLATLLCLLLWSCDNPGGR